MLLRHRSEPFEDPCLRPGPVMGGGGVRPTRATVSQLGIEGAVILVSILAAFALDSWSIARQTVDEFEPLVALARRIIEELREELAAI
jgi:hypothetical protein